MSVAGICIHSGRREVWRGDKFVRLTLQQFDTFEKIWKSRAPITAEDLHRHVHALRPECDWPETHATVRVVCAVRELIAELGIVITKTYKHGPGYTLKKLPTAVQRLREAA